jgi:hypothetical protein
VSLSDEIRDLRSRGYTHKQLIEMGFAESTVDYALYTKRTPRQLLGGAGRFSSGLVVDSVTEPEPAPEAFYRQDIATGRILLDRREDALKYRGGAY